MLAHGLEVVCEALKLRRGRLLPPGAAAEELAIRQDLWTYAVVTAALLHDIGKPVTDLRLRVYDQQGRDIGCWDPWAGPLTSEACRYQVEFIRDRRYRFHEQIPPLLVHFFLPQRGLSWLASDPEVFETWLATISGALDKAGVLGELVQRSDGLSVARDLAGGLARMPTARRKPLSARLWTGLRYLLDQNALPLNRPGAAGWRLDDDLWLVSKRALDALREHLNQEGQEGVPARNDRLMDELQQHGLLQPNGDRAVWTVQVTTGDWSQRLTVLRFPVHTFWPDPDARPPAFDGSVTPIEQSSDIQREPEAERERPSPENHKPGHQADEFPSTDELDESEISPQDTTQSDTDAQSGETDSPDSDDPGDRFLFWLKAGIASGRLAINAVNARVHVVPEGLLLVSPGIFKDFDRENWSQVQKRFQKLSLHQRTPQATNIWAYQVKGDRKQSRINGVLIADPERALELQLPPPNPHLLRKE